MYENERGMTLVEILAAIVISTIIMGIIWATFRLSMDYTSVENKKTQMQQEVNIIISEIQRFHRQCDSYKITLKNDQLKVSDCENPDVPTKIFASGYLYSGHIYLDSGDKNEYSKSEESLNVFSRNEDLNLDPFIISDSENPDLSVGISTVVTRYKTNSSGDG